MQHLFQCNQLHVPAGGCCFREIEGLIGVAFFQLIQHADFRSDDKFLLFTFGRMLDDACGGADVICQLCHSFGTFGMHQNLCIGVCVLQLLYLGRRDILMDGTVAIVADNLHRVGGGHAYVRPGFDFRCGIDVADNRQILVGFSCRVHLCLCYHVRHGAVRACIRHQHLLFGA